MSIALSTDDASLLHVTPIDMPGFDNIEPYTGYDSNVLNMYFRRYLPLAVSFLFVASALLTAA
jgi:hypothetical protein